MQFITSETGVFSTDSGILSASSFLGGSLVEKEQLDHSEKSPLQ